MLIREEQTRTGLLALHSVCKHIHMPVYVFIIQKKLLCVSVSHIPCFSRVSRSLSFLPSQESKNARHYTRREEEERRKGNKIERWRKRRGWGWGGQEENWLRCLETGEDSYTGETRRRGLMSELHWGDFSFFWKCIDRRSVIDGQILAEWCYFLALLKDSSREGMKEFSVLNLYRVVCNAQEQ